jgi:hypothetical protein
MKRSRARQKPAPAGSTVREILNRNLAQKISIANATLPENMSRINRALIEIFQADRD